MYQIEPYVRASVFYTNANGKEAWTDHLVASQPDAESLKREILKHATAYVNQRWTRIEAMSAWHHYRVLNVTRNYRANNRRFETLAEAEQHANNYHRRTGIFVAVEAV